MIPVGQGLTCGRGDDRFHRGRVEAAKFEGAEVVGMALERKPEGGAPVDGIAVRGQVGDGDGGGVVTHPGWRSRRQ